MIPSTCKTLVLATGNPHKVRELERLLSALDVRLTSLTDWPATIAVEENGVTAADNARKKASGYARQLEQWVLADDTALCVDALDGAPGVRSARYAGHDAPMAANRARLLAELIRVPDAQRTAQFVCHLALADPAGEIITEATGVCPGRIRREATAGSFGFGYDTLFEVADFNQTLAELPPEITAVVGHRGRAVRALLERR
ncbi:MAG: non-canonical purine NTP pyrophosphatase [Pirellulaceae bacterium]